MGHFHRIVRVAGQHRPERSGTLFSARSDLTPHPASEIRIEVARYFVDQISVGEVISSGHDTFVTEPAGVSLIVPMSGRIDSAALGGATLSARVGGALLFSPNRRHTRVTPEGDARFLGVPIVFPRLELRETAATLGMNIRDRRRLDAFALSLGPDQSAEAGELMALARGLRDTIAGGAPALLSASAHRAWSRRLSEKLVCVLAAADLATLPGADPGRSADRHVRRALDFMQANHAEISTITEVADACEIGTRALEAAFRQLWSQAPHQALTRIRLEAARRALTGETPEHTVTEAALGAGFGHLGRFALAYRARFGEPPSETLRRARR